VKKSYRFLVTILMVGTYLLSACGGALPQQSDSQQGNTVGSSQSTGTVFTGTVESKEGTMWLISGQQVNVDGSTSIDSNIQVGDIVRVEASVNANGAVVALNIEVSSPDDNNVNDNAANDNASNDNGSNTDDDNANANDNSNTNDNSNNAPSGAEEEVFGMVEAITADSITIDGITYSIASFTEFKDFIAVGDQVKIHVIVNSDGAFTIREIEKSTSTGIGDDNGNSNDDNVNFNSNSNDDHGSNDNSDDHSNGNSNDDDDHDDNSNGNSNDD